MRDYIKSQGRFSRHAAINAIIHRSLVAVNVPSTLDHSPLAYADQMVNDLMVVLLHHGSLASVLFGIYLWWHLRSIIHIWCHKVSKSCSHSCWSQKEGGICSDVHIPPFCPNCNWDLWCPWPWCSKFAHWYQQASAEHQSWSQVPLIPTPKSVHFTTARLAMLPLYWAPRVACSLYSASLCLAYILTISFNVIHDQYAVHVFRLNYSITLYLCYIHV